MIQVKDGMVRFEDKRERTEGFVYVNALNDEELLGKRQLLKIFKMLHEFASPEEWQALGKHLESPRAIEAYASASGKRKEPSMKRVKGVKLVKDGNLEPYAGYAYEVDGKVWHVHKNDNGNWNITDPETGLRLGDIWSTRAEALKDADERKLYAKYAELNAKGKFDEQKKAFVKATGKKEDKPMKTEATKKTTHKQAQKKPNIAELRFKAIESPWEGVRIYQKNAKACIWVEGKTTQCADELKALGYKWSKKRRAWWLKPTAA